MRSALRSGTSRGLDPLESNLSFSSIQFGSQIQCPGICGIFPRHPYFHWQNCAATPVMVSKCHNSKCAAVFRYFGDGKLFEFPPDSIRETSQLFWLCDRCVLTFTLERRDDGEVRLVSKAAGEAADRLNRKARFHKAS